MGRRCTGRRAGLTVQLLYPDPEVLEVGVLWCSFRLVRVVPVLVVLGPVCRGHRL